MICLQSIEVSSRTCSETGSFNNPTPMFSIQAFES